VGCADDDRAPPGLIDAQLALASIAALQGPGAQAGAEALIELSDRHGLRRVDGLLQA
jgi:hypothetical protein